MNISDGLKQSGLLRPGMRVLCALSGGGDSVCLTHALAALAPELSLTVAAAHFSHGLRPEAAEAERTLCQALCARLDIPLLCGSGDTPSYAADHHLSTEQAARTLRYTFLEQSADAFQADAIAVAHQQEDNAETLLLNLIRGCGSAGLEGIPPRRGRIIRPLLGCSREDIRQYLTAHQLDYVTDPTNLGTDNARALLRNQVFPLLHQLNPRAAQHMAQTAELLRQQNEASALEGEGLAERAAVCPEGLLISIPALLALSPEGACRALQRLQRQAGGQMLTRPQLEAALALCRSPSPSGQLSLSGTQLRRRYQQLLLCTKAAPPPPEPVTLTACGRVSFGSWEIIVQPEDGSGEGFCLPETAIFPLLIRTRRTGDRLELPGGSRTVKKWMIDRKIPKDLRDTTPILCHNNKILAVAACWHETVPPAETDTPRLQIICRRKRA